MSDKAITWGKIKVYDIQDSDLDTAEDMEFPFHPGSRFRAVNTGIDEPSVQINTYFKNLNFRNNKSP